ncbi:MAG TPA: hydantoinase/oxoprolinase family protein, partial [Thermodesulfobacteriota bacterium]|nr:hydantoinase/oxoprolinase family protein [Thermodesulfobacteriota bacterium]
TTNAVLTGKYAKTGLLTTKGHRDWLQTRRGLKPSCYDSKEEPPEPIVPRRLRRVAEERIDCEGKVLVPLNEQEVRAAAEMFRKEKVEAVAVCFLFSFLNPAHEDKAYEILAKELPGVYVSLSSKVLPQIRVYERGSTTVFNAAVGPVLRSYARNLVNRLKQQEFKGFLLIMQSNGGMMSPEVAMDFAVNTLMSGPAAGPMAGIFYGDIHGCKDLITVDMGGTSFDSCMVRNREPEITTELEVAHFKMAAPSIAIETMGAGGGSIAWIDAGGIFRVGPQSAGADPGPACYDMGGTEPTVTDGDVVCGYLNPDYFLAGKKKLYPELSKKVIKEKLADKLGLSAEEAAYGIYRIVNSNMAQGTRLSSVNKGYDPRLCLLINAGGAGPVHACDIAKELEMSLILIPKTSSVFCASGMLISDLRHDFVRVTHMVLLPEYMDVELINARFQEMREEANRVLEREGIPPKARKFTYSADIRYEAQFNEIETPLNLKNNNFTLNQLPVIHKAFNQRHDTLYGYSLPDHTQELMSLRLTAWGMVDKPTFAESPFMGKDASKAMKGKRQIYYAEKHIKVPIYDGPKMGNGNEVVGPAIIEEPTTTILLTPDWQLTCDRYSNYLLYRKGQTLKNSWSQVGVKK